MASTANYLGTVPRASGTGPKNFSKTIGDATRRRGGRPAMRRAGMPTASAARAGGASRPPAGAGSGIAKATTPFASSPNRVNKPKTARPGRSPGQSHLAKPRADFPPKI